MRTKIIIGSLIILGLAGWFYFDKPVETFIEEPLESIGGIPNQDFFDDIGVKIYTACNLQEPKLVSIADSFETLMAKNPDNSLRGLNNKEIASLKGCEIAKVGAVEKHRRQWSSGDFYIEIVDMIPINGGVDILARAWYPNGEQVGFGDGTVDIERFKYINPPVFVPDVNGSITRFAGKEGERKVREDPKEAILNDLVDTISQVAVFGDDNIVYGKVGNTEYVGFPAEGNNEPFDAEIGRNIAGGEDFATIIAAAGTVLDATGAAGDARLTAHGSTANDYVALFRQGYGFDISEMGTDVAVSSSTFSVYGRGLEIGLGDTDLDIVDFTPANEASGVAGDFTNFGNTRYATGIAISAGSTSGYNHFLLNSLGRAEIEGEADGAGANVYFGTTLKWDTDSNFTGSWSGGAQSKFNIWMADHTTGDPKLIATYGPAPPPSAPPSIESDFIIFE